MEYINVRGLDKPVPKLIFGTAWFSLDAEEEAHKMMDLYVERGGNMIDTGRYYGKGNGIAKSEEILDRWLRNTKVKREDIMISDKCCNCLIDRKGRLHEEFVRVSPTFIQEDLMYSLDRVGVDYFDLYLIHRDDPHVPVEALMDKMEELRIAGYFKAFGVSSWQPSSAVPLTALFMRSTTAGRGHGMRTMNLHSGTKITTSHSLHGLHKVQASLQTRLFPHMILKKHRCSQRNPSLPKKTLSAEDAPWSLRRFMTAAQLILHLRMFFLRIFLLLRR